GLHWLNFVPRDFALMNMLLAAIWFWVAIRLGRLYTGAADRHLSNEAPMLTRSLVEQHAPAGQPFSFSLPADSFTDPDPGDVLRISATLSDGSPLPPWLRFDPEMLSFSGSAPDDIRGRTELAVQATDFDGVSVSAPLLLHHDP
ncbi:MAG: putative Ig domain-containing protein, partial [Gammaproteobacteria bacterium]